MKSKTLLLSMTLTIAGLFCFDITEALSQMMMSGNMMHEGMSEQMQKGGMMGQGKMMHQGGMMGQGEMMHHGTMAEPSTKGAEMPSGKVVDGVRTIDVEAFQFGYSPNPIVVRTNEKVKLNLTTRDVTHGFGIGELNINVKTLYTKLIKICDSLQS